MATTGSVLDSINSISSFLLGYAGTLAALGALTVALIEAWKKLRDSQAKFHRASVLRWFGNDESSGKRHYFAQAPATSGDTVLPEYAAGRGYEQLLLLATGVGHVETAGQRRFDASRELDTRGGYKRSIEYALFELEIDRLMGQIQDAADVALNNPKLYPDLFQFLTRSALPEDVRNWVSEVGQLALRTDIGEQQRKEVADRYTRLKQTVRRHLDSFQIVTAMRWREWNQLAAVLVGAVLLLAAQLLALGHADTGHNGWEQLAEQFGTHPWLWIKVPVVALFGGMLAPVAKDLVDALRKVKSSV